MAAEVAAVSTARTQSENPCNGFYFKPLFCRSTVSHGQNKKVLCCAQNGLLMDPVLMQSDVPACLPATPLYIRHLYKIRVNNTLLFH